MDFNKSLFYQYRGYILQKTKTGLRQSFRKGIVLLAPFLLFLQIAGAQSPQAVTSADIYLGLRKLNVLGSVLYIAAHPDDENTRLLAYLAKEKLYRTGYLSLTRGDGGQNLIGEEQGVELGLIRTQELLSARRIDGAEQFFSKAYDFGFSKGPGETFQKWDKEKILSDVVWVIRKFKPDVIITRFPTTGEGGHGHHTASAILANEAFTAAADPKRFPEQLQYVQPWQAKRILWNTFSFGSTNTTASDQFHFDVGGFNALLGKSYGEIAAESRTQHKSQGFGVPKSRGEVQEYFRLTGGASIRNDLMDEVNTTWTRIGEDNAIAAVVSGIISSFDFIQPQKSVPALVSLYKKIAATRKSYWRDKKLEEVADLIEKTSGLWMEAYTTEGFAVQGDSIRLNTVVNNRGGIRAVLKRLSIAAFDTSIAKSLDPNKNMAVAKWLYVPYTKELTQPYWLKRPKKEGYFDVTDQQLIGRADVEPAYEAVFTCTIEGEDFNFVKPVYYKFSDQVRGEQYQPLFVVPPATVTTSPHVLLFKKAETGKAEVSVAVTANKTLTGQSKISLVSAAYGSSSTEAALNLQKGYTKEYSLPLAKGGKTPPEQDFISGQAQINQANDYKAKLALKSISYDHIPAIKYFYTDSVKVLNIDLVTAGKTIGYITGAGDKVPEALEQMGYKVTMLGEKELEHTDLSAFDAIISGVRAFNADEWIGKYYDKLMKYVADGGNYIVQYSQANNIKSKIGPYPFVISARRITDEGADVTFLAPEAAVVNYPNKITAADFKGWLQERSIYHADNLDSHYTAIFRMADPGEGPHDGSLIIAPYGKGYFTYTGLVFFRELPAGVPGAYRLLANIIALNQKRSF